MSLSAWARGNDRGRSAPAAKVTPLRSPRWRLAAIAVIAGAAALAATASPAAGGATAASTSGCATSDLAIWLDTHGDGAAGSTYYHLEFTNLSGHACSLRGYPGVSAVNLAGHRLGSAASRESSHKPRVVRLANGATAIAVLRIVEAGAFPRSSCRQVTAAGLRVHPPNRTAAKSIPFPFSACSRTGPVYLSVQAVQKA